MNGTKNVLLNEAFKDSHSGNHKWVQAIYHLLTNNGFKYMWYNPPGIRNNFHNVFRQRLYDQFIQGWYAKISESTKLSFLSDVKTIYKRSQYIDMIKKSGVLPYFYLIMDRHEYLFFQ